MSKEEHLVSFTAEELAKLSDRTDWARIEAMSEEEIELNAQDDIMENLAGFKTVGIRIPPALFSHMVSLDDDALNWIKNKGIQPQKYIDNLIRQQMKTHPDA